MRWEQPVQYASMTAIGRQRRNNQDALAVKICPDRQTWAAYGHLFLVADGVAGQAVGELASKIAADTLPHTFFKSSGLPAAESLKRAVEAANTAIYERGAHNRDFRRMGTTCSALVLCPQGALIGHVGDSRVYRVRGDRIDQLTFDHSLQWELLRQGKVKLEENLPQELWHSMTRALGPAATVKVDCEGPYPTLPGDVYVVCSDGLTTHVTDTEIGAIVGGLPPAEACRLLVHLGNLRGGSDNITVIVVRVGTPLAEISADDRLEPASAGGGSDWRWLAGCWVPALGLSGGVSAGLLGQWRTGLALIVLALIAVAALVAAWRRQRSATVRAVEPASPVEWRPYRSASAAVTRQFLGQIAAIEAALRRMASDAGWPMERPAHGSASAGAAADCSGRSLLDYARAINVLMTGLHRQRKRGRQRNGKPIVEARSTELGIR